MRRCAFVLLSLLGIFLSSQVFADAPSDLMQVNVIVPDQSSTSFQQGVKTAFTNLMTQLSNDPQITAKPVFQNATKNIMQYVQSYQYVQQTNTVLQITFDRVALQKLLKQPVKTAQQNPAPSVQHATVAASLLQLTIVGINNMTDYENALHTLREKSGVEKVSASEVSGDRVQFAIHLVENATQFERDLSSDHHFRASAPEQYTWVGSQA